MTLKTISGGWRGFSKAKETAFGTVQTVDTSLNFVGDPIETVPGVLWDDRDENTGELAPTRQQIVTLKSQGKHSQNLMPHNAALFFAWLLGNCATTNPSDPLEGTVRNHKITTDKSVVELVTRTMREYDGAHYMEYPGMLCSEVTLSGAREDFCKLEATLLGMGKESEISPAPSRPAQVTESYLIYGDCNIKKGGTYNGTTVSGGTSASARVRDWKASFKNGAKMQYFFGDATKYAGRGTRGRMLDVSLEMSLEFEDRTEKTSLLACTEFVMEIPIVGALIGNSTTNYYTVRLVFPSMCYNKAERGVDDGLLLLNAGFTALADATYGPCDIHVCNAQTQYI